MDLPLALVAAPLFEEFIFRGLIFGGLRRSFGVWPATLASAAVFAIVHPAIAIAPVFVMGVCAALLYERTRSLLAPMLAHAVYNALRDRRSRILRVRTASSRVGLRPTSPDADPQVTVCS